MSQTPDNRDAWIERPLRELVNARGAEPTAACLDADTLAAWVDDALDGRARDAAEAHAAGCARCQAMLAAMARTEPPPRVERAWGRLPLIGWLVPLAAVAVVAIAVVIPGMMRARMSAPQSRTAALQSPSPPPPASAVDALSPSAAPADAEAARLKRDTAAKEAKKSLPADSAASPSASSFADARQQPQQQHADRFEEARRTQAAAEALSKLENGNAPQMAQAKEQSPRDPAQQAQPPGVQTQTLRARADAQAAERAQAQARTIDQNEQARADDLSARARAAGQGGQAGRAGEKDKDAGNRAAADRAAASPPPPPPPPPASSPAPVPAAPPAAVAGTAPAFRPLAEPAPSAAAPKTAAAVGGTVAAAPVPARDEQAARGNALSRPANSLAQQTVIVSPDRANQWLIGQNGTVMRSTDGGRTWDLQQTGATTTLTAGAAAARNVCWFVGRTGLVVLTLDGRTWRRLPAPDAADLTAVAAIDDHTATVTTADGRVFSTLDRGTTWVPVPKR